MPLITESYDSLPYIDADPTPSQREHAQSLITAELAHLEPPTPSSSSSATIPSNDDEPTHPLLPPPAPQSPFLTPLHTTELARIASSKPLSGIDLSRYEQLDPPSPSPAPAPSTTTSKKASRSAKSTTNPSSSSSSTDATTTLDPWRATLRQAYISHTYLQSRTTALDALAQTGKDDWLAGNETLVALLGALEMELLRKREAIDGLVVERERAQRSVEGELRLLEEGWRKGVGKVLETELAAEKVRVEVLQRRREGAS